MEKGTFDSFYDILEDPSVHYLVDSCEPLSEQSGRKAKTLAVSSLNQTFYKNFMKESGTVKLFMPVWSFDELELVRSQIFQHVTAEQLKMTYSICGGNCLYAMRRKSDDAQADIDAAVVSSYVDDALLLVYDAYGISERLVHNIVDADSNFRRAHYDICSPYVVRKLQRRLEAKIRDYFGNFSECFSFYPGGVYFGTLAGRFFEDYAIRALCEEGSFTARRINDTERQVEFPELNYPDDIADICSDRADMQSLKSNKFGVPVSSAIDAVRVTVTEDENVCIHFFHMKNVDSQSSSSRKLKKSHLTRLRDDMIQQWGDDAQVRLYQVVSDFRYAESRPLVYYNDDGERVDDNAGVAGVEEWILSIPTRDLKKRQRMHEDRDSD